MSAWSPLAWQRERWQQLKGIIADKRLAHALLLAGPRGAGKGHFANGIASFLLCESEPARRPCGTCRSCGSLRAGTHPNAWLLEPRGLYGLSSSETLRNPEGAVFWVPDSVRRDADKVPRDIGIDGARELIDRMRLSSGGAKVAVISPADSLNTSSVNALLKIVEEPPANTHVIFVAERWRALPATLRSRCQMLRFPPPPAGAVPADAALSAERAEWSRALADAMGGNLSLKIAQGVKRDHAQAGLEHWLHAGTAWLRTSVAGGKGASPASAESLQLLLADCVEALRALERNGNPTLLVESIMIRQSQRAASRR